MEIYSTDPSLKFNEIYLSRNYLYFKIISKELFDVEVKLIITRSFVLIYCFQNHAVLREQWSHCGIANDRRLAAGETRLFSLQMRRGFKYLKIALKMNYILFRWCCQSVYLTVVIYHCLNQCDWCSWNFDFGNKLEYQIMNA